MPHRVEIEAAHIFTHADDSVVRPVCEGDTTTTAASFTTIPETTYATQTER